MPIQCTLVATCFFSVRTSHVCMPCFFRFEPHMFACHAVMICMLWLMREMGSPTVSSTEGPAPKNIRFVFVWPFRRLEALVQLIRLCCFPLIREECMRHGWRLIIVDPYSEIDPSQDPRPDTLIVCQQELQRCVLTSGGPAVVCLLDHSRQILPS